MSALKYKCSTSLCLCIVCVWNWKASLEYFYKYIFRWLCVCEILDASHHHCVREFVTSKPKVSLLRPYIEYFQTDTHIHIIFLARCCVDDFKICKYNLNWWQSHMKFFDIFSAANQYTLRRCVYAIHSMYWLFFPRWSSVYAPIYLL